VAPLGLGHRKKKGNDSLIIKGSTAKGEQSMREAVTVVVTTCLCILTGFFAVDKLCLGYKQFQLRATQIEKESWLRAQCMKPEFYNNIRFHTTLCEEVEATARIGAVWFAVNEVASSLPMPNPVDILNRASWATMACAALVLLVCPSLIISQLHHAQPLERTRIPFFVGESSCRA